MEIVVFIIALVLLLGIVLFIKPKRTYQYKSSAPAVLDRAVVKKKWHEIEEAMSWGKPSNFKTAVLDADKLVDYVLKGLRVPGNGMGDRLKNARNKFSNYDVYNDLWFAHKVRNDVVHEVHHELLSHEAKRAIDGFKKALEELRVL